MNDLIETINQLKEQLQPLPISREDFLALCVQNRLAERAEKYNREFQSFLDVLERDYISQTRIRKLTKSLKIYSQTNAIIYRGLIQRIKTYDEKLLRR